jgi:hypothetical protein
MPDYDSVTIEWVRTRYHGVEFMEDCFHYAIVHRNVLRYIGESCVSAPERVTEYRHIRKRFEKELPGCWIWFGYIQRKNFVRVTKQRILDIESLLIYLNQPTDNVPHKKSYRKAGRQDLIIHNKNCPQLLPAISIRRGNCSPKIRLPK